MTRRSRSLLIGIPIALAVALGALCVGEHLLSPGQVLRAIADALLHGAPADPSREFALVVYIRLPRVLAALAVGASLGAAGCMLQALLRNPLASPFVIGSSSAAGFGAVLAIMLGLGFGAILVSSFAVAVTAGILVLGLARHRGRIPREALVLAGLGVGLVFSAGTGLIEYSAEDEARLRDMVVWLLGGLWRVSWTPLLVHLPVTFLALLLATWSARVLDPLALGEFDARRLGVNVGRARTSVLVLACLLTSLAVSLAGVVAFVGLVVPHVMRRLVGVSHGRLVPAAAVGGAVFLVLADTVARTVWLPMELPLGVVTSLVGAPFFLAVLRSVQRKGSFL